MIEFFSKFFSKPNVIIQISNTSRMEKQWPKTQRDLRLMSTLGFIEPAPSTNINKLSNSMKQVEKIIARLKRKKLKNYEAIATWERVLASLSWKWQDAIIDQSTRGTYI